MSSADATGMVSLALVQIAGEEALAARVPVALDRAREVLGRVIARTADAHQGRVVPANLAGTLLAFPDVRSAAGFALVLQRDLLAQDWPSSLLVRPEAAERREGGVVLFRGLTVRVALHAGEPCSPDAPHGLAPLADQAGRLALIAGPGQVLLTDRTWRALVGNPGVPFVLRDLGAHRLAGVPGRHRLLQIQASVLDKRPVVTPASVDEVRTNRPEPGPPLLGRAGELSAIGELYRLGVRLVTVVGPQGTGKRALAAQVAVSARDEGLTGGVWWCTVAPRPAATDDGHAGDLVRSLGDALGVGISHARTDLDAASQLGWSLAARETFLVVIEGLDPTDAEAVSVLGRWVRTAPGGRFLCLARRKLGLPNEVVFQLGALAVRPAPSDAARWLLQHVPARAGGAALDPLRVEPLARSLRGEPARLAIAAGLLGQLSPEELGGRLADGELLAIAWDLCSDADRDLLRSVARFVGAVEPWQVAQVVDPRVVAATDVARMLADLAARSLLEPCRVHELPVRDRYVVPPLLRSWLASVPDPDGEDRERRWATSTVGAAECWFAGAHGGAAPEVLARLAVEAPNVLAVARWGLAGTSGDSWRVDLAARGLLALQPVFETRGPFVAQVRMLDLGIRALDASLEVDPSVQVRLLVARAEAMAIRGKGRGCLPDLERGQEIARRWSDPLGEALCRLGIGIARGERPEDDPSAELEEVAGTLAGLGATRREAIALATAGRVHFAHGRADRAEALLRNAVETARAVGARRDEGRFLADLARVLWGRGRLRPARSTYREAARLHAETGDRRREAHVAASLGDLDQIEARLPDALASYALASRIARETGERRVECHAQAGTGMASLELGDIDGSRRALLAALAILRDLGDARGEGTVVGQLGLVHHVGSHPTAARDYYVRALQMFPGPTDRRERITWLSWLGALLAEQGEIPEALDVRRQVVELLAATEERSIAELAALLGAVVDLHEAVSSADPERAEALAAAGRERWRAARADRSYRAPEARLALTRLERAMEAGSPVATR